MSSNMAGSPSRASSSTRSSTGQAFIDVTDSTANAHCITNVVQKRWGTDFQLVTADGLQLEDSSGTQGTPFTFKSNVDPYLQRC